MMPYKNPTAEQREKMRKWSREWMKRNPELRSARRSDPEKRAAEYQQNRLRKFKLTRAQMQTFWADQLFACAICYRPFATAFDGHIDHDHSTGKVRGLLCSNCNTGIGLLGDSAEICGRAQAYLRTLAT